MASSRMPFADPRRERWRCLGGVLLVIWLTAAKPALGRDPTREPGRGPPVETGPPPNRSNTQSVPPSVRASSVATTAGDLREAINGTRISSARGKLKFVCGLFCETSMKSVSSVR